MIEQLDQVPTTGIIDKFADFTAKKLLQLKLKLGMGLNEKTIIKLMNYIIDIKKENDKLL